MPADPKPDLRRCQPPAALPLQSRAASSDGLPRVGRSASRLGVRVFRASINDLPVHDGFVQLNEGGISVTPDDPLQMPPHQVLAGAAGRGSLRRGRTAAGEASELAGRLAGPAARHPTASWGRQASGRHGRARQKRETKPRSSQGPTKALGKLTSHVVHDGRVSSALVPPADPVARHPATKARSASRHLRSASLPCMMPRSSRAASPSQSA